MPVITLPTAQLVQQFGRPPKGFTIEAWDLLTPARDASEVVGVLLPNYFNDEGGFRRLAVLPKLQFIQLPSSGFDRVAPQLPEGVTVSTGRGIHDAEIAELAVGLVLASLRGIDDAVRDAANQEWNSQFRPALASRKVLLIGYGSIGSAVARRLAPFDVTLTAVAHSARDSDDGVTVYGIEELPDLLPTAEIVILTVPLTENTRGLVDAAFLAALPFGARIINVSRGAVVDTDALVVALQSRRLYAALDVTDPEPLPEGHPLWSAPHLILTPHIGGKTTATEARTLALVRRQVYALAEGRPLENVIIGGTAA